MDGFGDFGQEGFQQTQWPQSQFGGAPGLGQSQFVSHDEDDLTEEERDRMQKVEEANQKRRADLYTKQESEEISKRDRKQKAESELRKWQKEREDQINLRRQNNVEQEKQYFALIEEHRKGNNPWERVVDNCTFTASSTSAGGKDMSRMKSAILARKADITKAGGMQGAKML